MSALERGRTGLIIAVLAILVLWGTTDWLETRVFRPLDIPSDDLDTADRVKPSLSDERNHNAAILMGTVEKCIRVRIDGYGLPALSSFRQFLISEVIDTQHKNELLAAG